MQENIFIKNKKGLKLAATIARPIEAGKHPFIMLLHGFKGYKEEEYYKKLAETLLGKNIGSIRFDASGFAESEGGMEKDYRFSNYIADAESVYEYLSGLDYVDIARVGIFGHSVGGMQAIIFSANHPEIKALCVISAPNEIGDIPSFGNNLEQWKKQGHLILTSSKYGEFKIPYDYFEDGKNWLMTDYITRINCPLLVVLGLNDRNVLPESTRKIFSAAGQPKQLVEIENMDHFYKKDSKMLNHVNDIALNFFSKYLI